MKIPMWQKMNGIKHTHCLRMRIRERERVIFSVLYMGTIELFVVAQQATNYKYKVYETHNTLAKNKTKTKTPFEVEVEVVGSGSGSQVALVLGCSLLMQKNQPNFRMSNKNRRPRRQHLFVT